MTLPPDIGLPSQICPELALAAVLELLAPRTSLVEIDSFGLHTVLSPRNRRDAVASGLRLTVHGPYGFDIDPGSPDEALRRQTVALHRRHVEAAAEMGALLYVVHPDYVAPPGPRDAAVVAALQRTIADLEEIQREVGVRIAIENMPGVGSSQFTAPATWSWVSSGSCSTAATPPSAARSTPSSTIRTPAWPTSISTATGDRPTPTTLTGRSARAWSTRRRCWPPPAPPRRRSSSSTWTNRRPWRASPTSRLKGSCRRAGGEMRRRPAFGRPPPD